MTDEPITTPAPEEPKPRRRRKAKAEDAPLESLGTTAPVERTSGLERQPYSFGHWWQNSTGRGW